MAFWTVRPHLNVISINEVYEAGSKTVPITISPIRISLEQVDDILAYVASINPKDLGKPINFWQIKALSDSRPLYEFQAFPRI